MLILLAGFTGAAIGAFPGVAQSVRTLRFRSVQGVSRVAWLMSTTAAGLWLTYGFLERSGPQLLANTPWFASCVLIGVFMARARSVPAVVGYALPWSMLVVGAAVLLVERSALAVIGPAFAFGMTVPQIITARRAPSVAGVSRLAWASSVLSGVLWVVYGVGTGDVPVAVSSATATALNVAVFVTVTQARRREAVVRAQQVQVAPLPQA